MQVGQIHLDIWLRQFQSVSVRLNLPGSELFESLLIFLFHVSQSSSIWVGIKNKQALQSCELFRRKDSSTVNPP